MNRYKYVRLKGRIPGLFLWAMEKLLSKGYYKSQYRNSKYIFVHVPKNAGVSVNLCLYGVKHLGHNPIANVAKYDPAYLANRSVFALIRCPYERFVSAYSFVLQGGGEVEVDPKFVEIVSSYSSIDDFVIHWLSNINVETTDPVFRSQSSYLTDNDGNVLVENIFEITKNGMNDLRQYLKDNDGSVNLDLLSTPRNVSVVKSQTVLSVASKKIIRKVYADDFENFGFE